MPKTIRWGLGAGSLLVGALLGAVVAPSVRADGGAVAPGPTPRAIAPAAPLEDADAAAADGPANGAADDDAADDDDRRPSGTVGLDVVSVYFDRGYLIEDRPPVIQPWASVDVPIVLCNGPVRSVRWVADVWGSLQGGDSGVAGAPHAPKAWYEGDVWLGLAVGVGEHVDVRLDYAWSWSPNGAFERFEEVALTVSLDDEASWSADGGRFRGFAPTVMVVAETRGQNDGGRHLGRYAEATLEPRWALAADDAPAVDLSLPLRVGVSLRDYYEDADGRDECFGFAEGGVRLTVDLARLACALDGWNAIATVGATSLGGHVADQGDGRRTRFVASFGLAREF